MPKCIMCLLGDRVQGSNSVCPTGIMEKGQGKRVLSKTLATAVELHECGFTFSALAIRARMKSNEPETQGYNA